MRLLDIADEAITEHGAMQKPTELATLLALVYTHRPKVIWEIGTATGGTLWALATATRLAAGSIPSLVSIDLPGGPFSGGATIAPGELRALIPGSDVTIIHGDSRTVELPKPAPDFVLIDGDHSVEGVRADYDRYAPLVAPGGLVALHDIVVHPVNTGVEVDIEWRQIAYDNATVEIIDPSTVGPAGNQWGGIGVVFR